MKKITLIFLFISSIAYGQSITTFILVRHAEKATDDPKDPNLSEAGLMRAQSLAK